MIDDFIAINLRVDRRYIAGGQSNGFCEEAHEAQPDPMLFLKQVFVGSARFHHR